MKVLLKIGDELILLLPTSTDGARIPDLNLLRESNGTPIGVYYYKTLALRLCLRDKFT